MTLGLRRLTFFDFERGSLVAELFFSTLGLSGAVNAAVFYLNVVRERSEKQLDLLLTRPLRPLELILGRWVGFMAFQAAMSLVLLGGHLLESRLVQRPMAAGFWPAFYLEVLEVGMLAALYGFIALFSSEFWALFFMVAAFLLGHLVQHLQAAAPRGLALLGDGLLCLVPDLELSRPGPLPRPGGSWLDLVLSSSYFLGYSSVWLLVTAMTVRRARSRD